MIKITPTIDQLIGKQNLNATAKQSLLEIVGGWKLTAWEEALLCQLLSGTSVPIAEWGEWIQVMRGKKEGIEKFSYAELNKISWHVNNLQDINFRQRLAATVYWALNFWDVPTALSVRKKLEYASGGVMDFEGLPDDLNEWYQRLYLIICFYNYNFFSSHVFLFIAGSPLLALSYQIGFDFEEIIRKMMDGFTLFESRENLARQLAVFLLDNKTPLGFKDPDGPATVGYWIEKFRVYSHNSFDGMSLMNFIDDKNITSFCDPSQKELILAELGLYTHLVSGSLIVPDGDVEAVVKIASEIEKEEEQDRKITVPDKIDFYSLLNQPAIADRDRQLVRVWFKKNNNLLAVKDAIFEAVQKLNWADEPYLSNLIELSDLVNKEFGPAGILVYFDEEQEKFVLNKE